MTVVAAAVAASAAIAELSRIQVGNAHLLAFGWHRADRGSQRNVSCLFRGAPGGQPRSGTPCRQLTAGSSRPSR